MRLPRSGMATRSARITPAPPSGGYGGSVASARRITGTPVRAAALAAPLPFVDADGYLDFVPRAALDGGGGGGSGGVFPGAVPARGGSSKAASARPSKQAGDGAGSEKRPALKRTMTVRVDPSKQVPYTSKFITERKAGERTVRSRRASFSPAPHGLALLPSTLG